MATDANKAIADSKAALHNADNFGQRDTGNKKAGDKPAAAPAKAASPSYTAVRAARSTPNVGDELKAKADNVAEYTAATQ